MGSYNSPRLVLSEIKAFIREIAPYVCGSFSTVARNEFPLAKLRNFAPPTQTKAYQYHHIHIQAHTKMFCLPSSLNEYKIMHWKLQLLYISRMGTRYTMQEIVDKYLWSPKYRVLKYCIFVKVESVLHSALQK